MNNSSLLTRIKSGEIHLWMINPLKVTDKRLLDLYRTELNEEERNKVDRYRFEKHQHDALITRIFIRDILHHYTGGVRNRFEFTKGEHGRPDLSPSTPLQFNLSHTQELIICAVAYQQESETEFLLGADCEHIDRNNDIINIADRYFSPSEVEELFSLPSSQQRSRFFDYWTLKESYIKACGQGLAIPLDSFSFHIQDQQANYELNQIKQDILLSFAPSRNDDGKYWQSRTLYLSDRHRVSLSWKSDQIKNRKQTLSFFQSTPLVQFNEIELAQNTLFV